MIKPSLVLYPITSSTLSYLSLSTQQFPLYQLIINQSMWLVECPTDNWHTLCCAKFNPFSVNCQPFTLFFFLLFKTAVERNFASFSLYLLNVSTLSISFAIFAIINHKYFVLETFIWEMFETFYKTLTPQPAHLGTTMTTSMRHRCAN